jgi:hypothetical protein
MTNWLKGCWKTSRAKTEKGFELQGAPAASGNRENERKSAALSESVPSDL